MYSGEIFVATIIISEMKYTAAVRSNILSKLKFSEIFLDIAN